MGPGVHPGWVGRGPLAERFPENLCKDLPVAATLWVAMTATKLITNADGQAGWPIDWAAALAEHERWLRTVVRARLGEPQAVEEVIQDVSVAALEQRSPLADPSKVGAWLYRLAIRKSLLYRRSRGRQRKLAGRYAERLSHGSLGQLENDPLGWLLSAERHQLVRNALDRLAPRDAEILLLKYTENWTYRDLAEHLGTTTSAIEARLHRVRRRLREELSRAQEASREEFI